MSPIRAADPTVQMLAQAPAGHAGGSVAAALAPTFPSASQRLEGASGADRSEYMRVLKGACTLVLRQWPANSERPQLAQILNAINAIEGSS